MSTKDNTLTESTRNINKRSASPSKQEQKEKKLKEKEELGKHQEMQPYSHKQNNMDKSYELDMGILNEVPEDGSDENVAEAFSFLDYDRCQKKESHVNYVPIDQLFFPKLRDVYEMEDIVYIVEALGKLVVKIGVKHSSPNRPQFFPGTKTPYPKAPCCGTGKIIFSERKCNDLVEWGEIKIATSRHVVFDQSEGEHTTCSLNFDNHDSKVTELKCSKVTYVNTWQDNCLLVCKTDDMNLVKQLRDYIYDFVYMHEELYAKHRHLKSNDLVLTVSHPHGFPKKVSIGSYAEPNTNKYKLATCKGSSGAPIYRLNQEKVWVLELHSGRTGGLAISGVKL